VVNAEVAEVEVGVAHPGVLPVDDPDPRPVVDEVGVQEVVVARPQLERRDQAGQLDAAGDGFGQVELGRDRHPARHRERAIRLDDAERHEESGDRGPIVDPPQRRPHGAQPGRRAHLSLGDRVALDEPRDEVALRPEVGDDLRPDADAGRGHGRRVLHLAADAEEVGVVAGEPNHEPGSARRAGDEEVAVRDPARQGSENQLPGSQLRQPAHGTDELVAQLAAQLVLDRGAGHRSASLRKLERRAGLVPDAPFSLRMKSRPGFGAARATIASR